MAYLLLLLSGSPFITSVAYVYLTLGCIPQAHSHIFVNGDEKTSVSIESRSPCGHSQSKGFWYGQYDWKDGWLVYGN